MIASVLHDAVTLLHFAVIGRLDVLETRHGLRSQPRWAEAVHAEIQRGAAAGMPGCRDVLAAAWLGAPETPTTNDRRAIVQFMVALNDGSGPATAHGGEAESIAIAQSLGSDFVTDDNAAYEFARFKLGGGRVRDSVDVLREAVAMDELSPFDAVGIANAIRSKGRHLRRVHPTEFGQSYFK